MIGSSIILKEGAQFYIGGICTINEALDEETGMCKTLEWPEFGIDGRV